MPTLLIAIFLRLMPTIECRSGSGSSHSSPTGIWVHGDLKRGLSAAGLRDSMPPVHNGATEQNYASPPPRQAIRIAEPPAVKLDIRITKRFNDVGLAEPLPELHQYVLYRSLMKWGN